MKKTLLFLLLALWPSLALAQRTSVPIGNAVPMQAFDSNGDWINFGGVAAGPEARVSVPISNATPVQIFDSNGNAVDSFGGGVGTYQLLSEQGTDGGYSLLTIVTSSPGAGSCNQPGEIVMQTDGGSPAALVAVFVCPAAGENPVAWPPESFAAGTGISINEVNNVITISATGSSAARAMALLTVEPGAANAFVDTIDGTNFDYSGVRFVDAATGKANFGARLVSAPTNMILTSKAVSGSGGNLSLGIYCVCIADNEAYDASPTYIQGASGNPAEIAIRTSANLSVNTISLSGLTMAAGDYLTCGIDRVGGDANDTLSADWLLIDVSIE